MKWNQIKTIEMWTQRHAVFFSGGELTYENHNGICAGTIAESTRTTMIGANEYAAKLSVYAAWCIFYRMVCTAFSVLVWEYTTKVCRVFCWKCLEHLDSGVHVVSWHRPICKRTIGAIDESDSETEFHGADRIFFDSIECAIGAWKSSEKTV